ncbi:restriction endonuclease subunit S [Intestinimonas timonensis]|jgi:type I restriction enzyme S subunit|uniref:restriction endonuclease subunit S n=1 Tax=Intestinimonas timonensis TaxID=1689270 RepID=UPI0010314ABF|nr:restriction endonuclease subunit S [Intestinimonas timonensis]
MRLGDCCKTNLHTYSDKEKWSLIRYLDTGSITEGRIDEIQTLYPGVDKIPSRARRKASVGDILFSTVRPNQKHYGIIEAGTENLLVSTGFTVVTVDTTIADPYFIYYYLTQSSVIESLQAIAEQSTSTYPSIKPSDIEDIELDLPELETQKKIGSTLRMLDRKIALNEEINDNLQQQLFSLYENMATASPCLKEYTLSNLCDFQEGYVNPPQTHPEYFDGEVKWLRAVDINESFIIETSRTLTKAGFESAKKSALLFEPNTIAISKSGTIGRLGIIADYMCGNRAVINIAPHDTNMLAFIYCFLKSKQREFPDMAVGSVQKNLYVSLLEPLSVSIPDNESLTAFNAVGASILGMIHNNCVENTDLANLRDTILPKLMSGEIDVSSVLL